MSEPETFDEAAAHLREFLQQNGFPQEVLWITEKDILVTPKRLIYVRIPIPEKNVDSVRELFEMNIPENGVWMKVVCVSSHESFCSLWTPRDADEAGRAFMRKGLKLSVCVNKSEAVTVNSRMAVFEVEISSLSKI